MNSYVLIGILGSVASIVSLLIAAPTIRSKLIHMLYGFLLTVVVGSSFIYNQDLESELSASKKNQELLTKEIERMNSIKFGALEILKNRGYLSTTDIGENRGFILTAFTYLEKHRAEFPESYKIAKELIMDGLKITKSSGTVGSDGYYDEKKRMSDGAATMFALLRGIAGEKI